MKGEVAPPASPAHPAPVAEDADEPEIDYGDFDYENPHCFYETGPDLDTVSQSALLFHLIWLRESLPTHMSGKTPVGCFRPTHSHHISLCRVVSTLSCDNLLCHWYCFSSWMFKKLTTPMAA